MMDARKRYACRATLALLAILIALVGTAVDAQEETSSLPAVEAQVPAGGEEARQQADATGGPEPEEVAEGSSLAVAEAQEFVGIWKVSLEFAGTPMAFTLNLFEVQGRLGARLDSPQGEQEITDITRTGQGLHLAFDSMFGRLTMDLSLAGEELSGTFDAENGGFSAELKGVRESGATTVASRPRSGRRSRLFGRPSPQTRVQIEGKAISIRFSDPATSDMAYEGLANRGEGEVVQFAEAAAIKLRTAASLQFGDTLIPVGNLAEDYPGVYSLWLKRVGDGWRLVFNEEADVWGTQHDPRFDVAEVPLEVDEPTEPATKLQWNLSQEGGQGLLQVAWGSHRWTARFAVRE